MVLKLTLSNLVVCSTHSGLQDSETVVTSSEFFAREGTTNEAAHGHGMALLKGASGLEGCKIVVSVKMQFSVCLCAWL